VNQKEGFSIVFDDFKFQATFHHFIFHLALNRHPKKITNTLQMGTKDKDTHQAHKP
jgi:hypothetical protein